MLNLKLSRRDRRTVRITNDKKEKKPNNPDSVSTLIYRLCVSIQDPFRLFSLFQGCSTASCKEAIWVPRCCQ